MTSPAIYRRVFVDGAFLRSLLAAASGGGDDDDRSGPVFDHLLDEYERGRTQLYTSRAAIGTADARSCDVMRVATLIPVRRALRRLARQVAERHPDVGPDRAEVLAIMRRHGISELATTDPWYDEIDGVTVVTRTSQQAIGPDTPVEPEDPVALQPPT